MILPKLCPLNLERYFGILTLDEHAKEVALLLHHQNLADDVSIEELTKSLSSNSGVVKHEDLLIKLQNMVRTYVEENPNPPTLIKQGCLVSSRSARIAPKTAHVVKVRHSRDPTFGNVLKQSEYFPALFLIYFYQIDRYLYCSSNVIKFETGCEATHRFSPGMKPSEHADLVGIKNKSDDSFLILFHILNGKIHNIEGPPGTNLTIPEIVKLFKPFFNWMTEDKLYKFISKHRSKSHTKQSSKKSITTNNNTSNNNNAGNIDSTSITPTKPKAKTVFAARESVEVTPGTC